MNKRKKLIQELTDLEQQWLIEQHRVDQHAQYLRAWYQEHRLVLISVAVGLGVGAVYLTEKYASKAPHSPHARPRKSLAYALVRRLGFLPLVLIKKAI